MKKAIITGSFDPITSGHEDLIARAARIFDEVTVAVLANSEKKGGMFTSSERLELASLTIGAMDGNIKALLCDGLTSEAAHKAGAKFIVRGARSASDFDYENSLANIMKRFDPELETVILPADPNLAAISSTYVRELLKYGCDLGDAVPAVCREKLLEFYSRSHSSDK